MSVVKDVTESPIVLLGTTDGVGTMEPDGIAGGLLVGTVSVTDIMRVTSITGVTTMGSPSVTVSVTVNGIASDGGIGSPALNSRISPTQGIRSTLAFGTPTAFISINPDGISSAGGGPGEPRLTMFMEPTGIASSVALGEADTLATVFVIPGPVDPSNDFGNATATSNRLIFRTPTQTLGWGWYKRFEGISVLKVNGEWVEVPWPTVQETLDATYYFGGGREHPVSTELAAELIAEGYTVTEEV